MQYQSDYILRLIEQMGSLIRRALEKIGLADTDEPFELLEQAVGLALDMDPQLAARLSPHSLRSLLELDTPDERVLRLISEALDASAGMLEGQGDLVEAQLKRDQASAVRTLLDPARAN